MQIDKKRIFLSDGCKLDRMLELLKSSGCCLEGQTFSLPGILTGDLQGSLEAYRKKIEPLKLPRLFLHGPFFDITFATPDTEIRAISEKRYRQGLDCAIYLGAERIIFHTQYNPQLRLADYMKEWLDNSLDFYRRILKEEKYSGVEILVENMFEDSPGLLVELLRQIDSPRMGICLDVGHVNVYGGGDFDGWMDQMAPYVRHVHLSDNDGSIDHHWPLGKGSIDFDRFFASLSRHGIAPDFCLELGNEKDLKESLSFINSMTVAGARSNG
jgi:sugar phosphate isomerase/epimerase